MLPTFCWKPQHDFKNRLSWSNLHINYPNMNLDESSEIELHIARKTPKTQSSAKSTSWKWWFLHPRIKIGPGTGDSHPGVRLHGRCLPNGPGHYRYGDRERREVAARAARAARSSCDLQFWCFIDSTWFYHMHIQSHIYIGLYRSYLIYVCTCTCKYVNI